MGELAFRKQSCFRLSKNREGLADQLLHLVGNNPAVGSRGKRPAKGRHFSPEKKDSRQGREDPGEQQQFFYGKLNFHPFQYGDG